MESSPTFLGETYRSVDSKAPDSGEMDPKIAEAIRAEARKYRVGFGSPYAGIEGIDFPSNVTPLRSVGPDIVEIDDDDSSEKAREDPDEEEDIDEEAVGEDEEEQSERDTPAASSSRPEEETIALGESSSAAPKKRVKRKIVPLDPDLIPDRRGKDPCPYWDCFEDQRGIELFRWAYSIPNDVVLTPAKGPRILFSDEHVTVPLMAITEGGLRFPMHKILRQILHRFGLTPCQLSVNSYRIIHSIIKLAEVKMFPLEYHHIFENYMMSRNVRRSRYYLCSRRNMEKIIPEGMYDSEKWASDYVEVRGNFQYPPEEYGQFEVAAHRGDPYTSKINKDLLRVARGCGLAEALLTIPSSERDAPTILEYDPTYGGRIRGKAGDKETKEKTVRLPKELLPSKEKPLRGTIRVPITELFLEEETMPPRGMKAVLQKRMDDQLRLLAEKKDGAPGASASVPSKSSGPAPQAKKRPSPSTHTSEDAPPVPKRTKPQAKSTGAGVSKVEEKDKEAGKKVDEGETRASSDADAPWAPSFIIPGKKQILKSDSLQEDPSLAFTLHSGLMLPRDIVAPQTLKTALSDYYFHVGRATQSIMSAQLHLSEHDKQTKLLKQKLELGQMTLEEHKKSLDHSEGVRRAQEVQIKTLNDLVKGLQDAADRTRAEGKDEGLEEGRALGRKEMEEEMKKSLQEEFDRGYFQAEEDAADQILALQTEMREKQHQVSFKLGFNTGFDEAGVEADDERRSLIELPPLPAEESVAEDPIVDEAITSPSDHETVATPAPNSTDIPPVTPTPEG